METECDLFLMQTPSDTSISSFLISLFTILHNLAVFFRMSLCSLLLIFFHAPNLIQAECTKSDESPSVTVWNSSHLHISWENAFLNCNVGLVERAYVKGSLDFGMALVNFSHGSITRKISPCSSYPDIRKVIQKDFA